MNEIDRARAAIADRAMAQLGTPFRLFGRTPGKALDCVGLALCALGPHTPVGAERWRYSLRGDQLHKARDCFSDSNFSEVSAAGRRLSGDIVLAAPAPSQLHFMICAADGWVHADAGLGRTVLRPGPLPWPAPCIWRLNGI